MVRPTVMIHIEGTSKGLTQELGRVRRLLQGFSNDANRSANSAKNVFSLVRNEILKLAGGFLVVRTAFQQFIGALQDAGEEEAMTAQFEVLLGSAEAAAERMEELKEFAKETPFDIPDVTRASRILEVLTRGALSTGNGLRFVGDASAQARRPIKEVAMWIGRTFDALRNNQPVGEAILRLMEMGLISSATKRRIEELQKTGVNGAETWNFVAKEINRFAGTMDVMSGTVPGLMSNLRDSWQQFRVEFGKPINEALKPILNSLINTLSELKPAARDAGELIAGVIEKLNIAVRVMISAFKEGDALKMFVLSLRIGMNQAVLILQRGLEGAINLLFDGIVAAFGILTSGAFWTKMWAGARAFASMILSGFVKARIMFDDMVRPVTSRVIASFTWAGNKIIGAFMIAEGLLREGAAFLFEQSVAAAKLLLPDKLMESVDNQIDHMRSVARQAQRFGHERFGISFEESLSDANRLLDDLRSQNVALANALDQFAKDKLSEASLGDLAELILGDQQDSLEGTIAKDLADLKALIGKHIPNLDEFVKERKETPPAPLLDSKPLAKQFAGFLGLGDALTTIGGGGSIGFGGPIDTAQEQLGEQRRTNDILNRIERNTQGGNLTVEAA